MKPYLTIAILLSFFGVHAQSIVINEVVSSNDKAAADQYGDNEDYIELYNPSSSEKSLKGFFLSDEADSLYKFKFPDIKIPAGGYLILWADGEPHEGETHLPFKLNSKGEILILTSPTLAEVDKIDLPRQFEDVAYARQTDGAKKWDYQPPSANKPNAQGYVFALDAKKNKEEIKVKAQGENYNLRYRNPDKKELKVEVIDEDDFRVFKSEITEAEGEINLSTLKAGRYNLLIGENKYRLLKR